MFKLIPQLLLCSSDFPNQIWLRTKCVASCGFWGICFSPFKFRNIRYEQSDLEIEQYQILFPTTPCKFFGMQKI